MFGKMKSANGLGHSHFTEVAPQAPWCWGMEMQILTFWQPFESAF
jgi:hypothetical protein